MPGRMGGSCIWQCDGHRADLNRIAQVLPSGIRHTQAFASHRIIHPHQQLIWTSWGSRVHVYFIVIGQEIAWFPHCRGQFPA